MRKSVDVPNKESDTVELSKPGTSSTSSLPPSPLPRECEQRERSPSFPLLFSPFSSFKCQFFLRQARLESLSTESLVFTNWNRLSSRRSQYRAGCATQPCSQDENSEPISSANFAVSAEKSVKHWRRGASSSFHGKHTTVKLPTHKKSPIIRSTDTEPLFHNEISIDESISCCSKNAPEVKKSVLNVHTKNATRISSRSRSCE